MSNLSYVLLSRQAALTRELDNIANNISNANTTGFRRDASIFTEFVNAIRGEPSVSQTRFGARSIDTEQGEMIESGGTLDLAIEGKGFFGVITPAGLRLTRAGAFLLNEEGVLTTRSGFPVAGGSGRPRRRWFRRNHRPPPPGLRPPRWRGCAAGSGSSWLGLAKGVDG